MRARVWLLGVLGASLLGCGSEIEATCERADECNLLRGRSAEECTADEEKRAEGLSDGEAADLETMLDACLEWESCDAFQECVKDVAHIDVED